MSEYSKEDIEKLKALEESFKNLSGVLIPYNIIVQNMQPLQKWLNKVLRGNENDYGVEGINTYSVRIDKS
jgi:hypothetical protein